MIVFDNMQDHTVKILQEISLVLEKIDIKETNKLIKEILKANIIVTCGAGRMGLAAKAFSMRLGQFGMQAYTIGDAAIPHVKKGDLLIVCSGSGETETVHTVASIAKKNGCRIALITSRKRSPIARLADSILIIAAHSKLDKKGVPSIQPMTTLMEQSTYLFFDALVLELMSKLKKTSEDMWKKHSNLE